MVTGKLICSANLISWFISSGVLPENQRCSDVLMRYKIEYWAKVGQ